MISQIFSKTKPVNFLLLSILLGIYMLSYEGFVGVQVPKNASFGMYILASIKLFLTGIGALIPALFLMDFILKRNKLVLTHAYTLFYFTVLTGVFTAVFSEPLLLTAHFFVLLGLRRVISLKTKLRTKKKIFEASLWFLVGSYFYDWVLLYFIVLGVAIFIYGKENPKHWGLLFWAAAIYALLLRAFVVGTTAPAFLKSHYLFIFPDFTRPHLFPLGAVLLFVGAFLLLIWTATQQQKVTAAAIGRQNSLYLILICGLVALALYVLYPTPTFAPLIFSFFPLAFLLSNATELLSKPWQRELALWAFFSIPLWGLIGYLLQN